MKLKYWTQFWVERLPCQVSLNMLQSSLNSESVNEVQKELQLPIFIPQPLRAVGVLFSPMVSGWAGGWAGGGKKFVRPVSQKP